ncbi:MAG: IS21 family transposase [Bdellovibrionales bacterium]|nr:IS21 family transposase [Bdellovibrionales bacterium]
MDRKIVELLLAGMSQNHIVAALSVGKKRVKRARREAERAGYFQGVPLPAYPEAVFPDPVDRRHEKTSDNDVILQEHLAWMRERLASGWQPITVWEELPLRVPRSSFYRFLERHKLCRLGESFRHTPEILHEPGEALLLDWGKLRDVVEDGKKRTLWAFVGVLGFSRYMMVRLVWSNDVATTIAAIESMFQELGGAPGRLTSDNPKCFALEASRYEPILNPVIERFAAHYGVRMECLPPADPEKKGKVERPMPYVRRLYQAHGNEWHGLEESQAYINKKVSLANERKHGTTRLRPIDDLVNIEAQALRGLPPLAYEIEEYSEGSVRRDGFVCFRGKFYSVDEALRGEEVAVVANATRVAIYAKGKLVETHARIRDPHQSKSIKPHHQKSWEKTLRDQSHYLRRAAEVGPDVERIVQAILLEGEGFVDTRRVWGILSLEKTYPRDAVNEACRKAFELNLISYQTVRSLLKLAPRPEKGGAATLKAEDETHKFVRPISEYTKQLKLRLH